MKRYLNFIKQKSTDEMLAHSIEPKIIESQIIDYIMSLRNNGIAYSTIQFFVAPIFTFYQLNDILLNRKKINRYMGEYKRVVKDLAYTIEQIQQMLQTADNRMRVIILLLSSTGCRIGALSDLVLGNLTKLPKLKIYRIVFYYGTNNEYYTFTTSECAAAIDNYLLYRQRCGEKISFNSSTNRWEPDNVPLLRRQFDSEDVLQARRPIAMTNRSIREALEMHLIRAGIREREHLTEVVTSSNSLKRVRKPVSLSTGFRKFVISTFIESNLNHEIRELIVDHATMLDKHYFRPREDQVLAEYVKAIPNLTIDSVEREKQRVQELEEKSKQQEAKDREIAHLSAKVTDLEKMVYTIVKDRVAEKEAEKQQK
jgi:integrase